MSRTLYDKNGRAHVINDQPIASGGQGAVYRTTEANIAVKLERNNEGEEIMDPDRNEKFMNIRLLPIPGNVNITLPLVVLKEQAGYVMTLLGGMESFEGAFEKRSEALYTNAWLKSLFEGVEEENKKNTEEMVRNFGDYILTGGKRRRMQAYLKCAAILSKLHANGLVYCDFSAKNVFISTNQKYSNVWLIDADNLNYQSITVSEGGFYTPGYAAPEVVQGKGCTFYSDDYSFAVSLFWQLTGQHPFKGACVENDEDEFADAADEKAYAGLYPWIADPDDDSNAAGSMPIPYVYILSDRIMAYFNRTFSETGKKKKTSRTSVFEWMEILAYELDHTVKCHHCEMEYVSDQPQCPWCDCDDNQLISLESFCWEDGRTGTMIWSFCQECSEGDRKNIPARLAEGVLADRLDAALFEVERRKDKLIFSNFDPGYKFQFRRNDGSHIFAGGVVEAGLEEQIICISQSTEKTLKIEVKVV